MIQSTCKRTACSCVCASACQQVNADPGTFEESHEEQGEAKVKKGTHHCLATEMRYKFAFMGGVQRMTGKPY